MSIRDFIDKKINVLFLTEKNINDDLKSFCEKKGFSFYMIDWTSSYISESDQNNYNLIIRDLRSKEKIEVQPNNTVVVISDSVDDNNRTQSFFEYFEFKQVPIMYENQNNLLEDITKNKKKTKEIGYLEKIFIPEIGVKLDATVDSGNGMFNVIDATEMKIIDDIVSFKTNNKKIVKKIQDFVDVNVGGMRDFTEKRVLVKFDVEFVGKSYKDIIFTLDDRPEPLSDVLLCRDFLSLVGVNINPKLKFTLGENINFKDFREMFL